MAGVGGSGGSWRRWQGQWQWQQRACVGSSDPSLAGGALGPVVLAAAAFAAAVAQPAAGGGRAEAAACPEDFYRNSGPAERGIRASQGPHRARAARAA